MLGDVEAHDPPARVDEDHDYIEKPERRGRDHEHVDRRDPVELIAQETTPGWRRFTGSPDHVLGDGRLADLNTEF